MAYIDRFIKKANNFTLLISLINLLYVHTLKPRVFISQAMDENKVFDF